MNVSVQAALINGFISFFSPCVLPLLPLYFSYLAGEALSNANAKKVRPKLMINTIGFILGISLLNVLIGFGAKFLANYLVGNKDIIRIFGGAFMILFGAYFISGIKIPFLEKDRKVVYTKYAPNFIKSFILGFTFSLGWSACNGPIVASITVIASFQKDYLRAGGLMLLYSLGFSIPFLVSSLLAGVFVEKSSKLKPYYKYIKIASGAVLMIMGILMVTNKINLI